MGVDDMPEEPTADPTPVVWTERDLYAVIGELFVNGKMSEIEIARLRAQLLASPSEVSVPARPTMEAETIEHAP